MRLQDTTIWFDEFNHRGNGHIYFLSHGHVDHMEGLHNNWEFGDIYCSWETKMFVLERYPRLESRLIDREIGEPFLVYMDVHQKVQMQVVMVDANHCPGSVMFLLDGYFGRVLYTGDFRYCQEMQRYHSILKEKTIDFVYMDNTLQYLMGTAEPPPQCYLQEQLESILPLYPANTRFVVGMETLGKENLVLYLAKKLNTQVVMSKERHNFLRNIDPNFDISRIVSDKSSQEAREARIWVSSRQDINEKRIRSWNENSPHRMIVGILLQGNASMGRQGQVLGNEDCFPKVLKDDVTFQHARKMISGSWTKGRKIYPKYLLVPFTLHSTLSEMVMFAKWLRPRQIKGFVRSELHELIAAEQVGMEDSRKIQIETNMTMVRNYFCELMKQNKLGIGSDPPCSPSARRHRTSLSHTSFGMHKRQSSGTPFRIVETQSTIESLSPIYPSQTPTQTRTVEPQLKQKRQQQQRPEVLQEPPTRTVASFETRMSKEKFEGWAHRDHKIALGIYELHKKGSKRTPYDQDRLELLVKTVNRDEATCIQYVKRYRKQQLRNMDKEKGKAVGDTNRKTKRKNHDRFERNFPPTVNSNDVTKSATWTALEHRLALQIYRLYCKGDDISEQEQRMIKIYIRSCNRTLEQCVEHIEEASRAKKLKGSSSCSSSSTSSKKKRFGNLFCE